MMYTLLRRFSVTCALVATLLSGPTASHACWLFGSCQPKTTYRPVYTAPACNPCQTQTVQYVPQTAYRPVCQNVPVTAYRPVTSRDPCTGCPVTCMRPVTSYVQRVNYVPYTTYRPVVTTAAYAPASAGCATGACGTTTVGYAGYGTAGCATGACGSASTAYAAPATTSSGSCCTSNYTQAPVTAPVTAPATAPAAPATTPQPTLAPTERVPDTTDPPPTFESQSPATDAAAPAPASSASYQDGAAPLGNPAGHDVLAPPEHLTPAASPSPQLVDPRDRTAATPTVGPQLRRPLFAAWATAQPHRRSATVPAVASLPAASAPPTLSIPSVSPAVHTSTVGQEQIDASGWRAARR